MKDCNIQHFKWYDPAGGETNVVLFSSLTLTSLRSGSHDLREVKVG
jgi:hypothetical protein